MNRPIHQPQRTLYGTKPPAQYLIRPSVAVDCSATAGITLAQPWQDAAYRPRVFWSWPCAPNFQPMTLPACLWLAAELEAPLASFDEKPACAAQEHLAALV